MWQLTKNSNGGAKLKVGFCSLGCDKNRVDTEVMLGSLRDAGFEICAEAADSDVIVVNTCAFIDEAKEESIETILEMARLKETGRCRRLVVAGCLSQRYRADLVKSIPEIDACLGIDEMDRIAETCAGTYTPSSANPALPVRLDVASQQRVSSTPEHYAYLKISDGCDHRCSFCVIPKIRGRHRSRPPEDIISEAGKLIDRGVVELVLVAQDLGKYGADIGLDDGLAHLVARLARLEGLAWLRLLYVYPEGISDRLVDLIAGEETIVPYLDIPLQHASPRVLADMGRAGGFERAIAKIESLRARVPGIALRTSLIVGFPTEEEEDFDRLLEFVAEARFDHLGAFAYSHEEDSDAFARFEDRWPPEVKAERRDLVMSLQREISLRKHEELIGKRLPCIVDGVHPESEHLLAGRLPTQSPDSDGIVIINEGSAPAGAITEVEITEAYPYDLIGRITDGK